jgi:hypothetical protein
MSALIKLYEHHAKDCALAAGRTGESKRREQLLNLAYEWAQAASVLRASAKASPSQHRRNGRH